MGGGACARVGSMNAVTKAVLAFLLFFTITFLYLHYLPGLEHYSFRTESHYRLVNLLGVQSCAVSSAL